MISMNRRFLSGAGMVSALVIANIAQAAQVMEEIIVTSQRREQSILDVPISVTAFNANMIERAGISEVKDYLQMTPNVSFGESGETGNRSVKISVRGVGDIDLGEVTTANSIGYYLDELSVGSTSNGVINPQLYDIERIEVLRGPQGTFFGRNASGGALNLSTKLPVDELLGAIKATYARFDSKGVSGMVNIPLSDTVYARFVAAYADSDGILKNINPQGAKNSGFEYSHFRGAIRALPTERLIIDFSVSYTNEDEGADALVPTGILDLDTKSIFGDFTPVDTVGFYPANQSRFDHDAKEFNENKFLILNSRISYDFERFSLRSITGLVDSETNRFFDQDNIFVDTIRRSNAFDGKSFSQELRLQSSGDWRVDWTLGSIYAKDEIKQSNSILAGAVGSFDHPNLEDAGGTGLLPPIPAGFRINANRREFDVTSWAIFGDFNWHVTDTVDLIVGTRYTHDRVSSKFFDVVSFESSEPDVSGSHSFTNFSPRVVLSWFVTPETNIYASASAGYKAGGIDRVGAVFSAHPFDEETLWSYEIGIKGTVNDRVRYSVATFYIDWEDLQIQSNFLATPGDISSAQELTLNADSARNTGIEGEILAQLTDRMTFSAGVGWLDSEIEDFPDARLSGGNVVNLDGQRLPGAPEWTWSTALDYRRPLPALGEGGTTEGYVRLDIVGRSGSRSDLEAVAAPILGLADFPYQSPGYEVVNLRFGLDNDNWGVQIFVENLLKEDYFTSSSDNFGLSGIRVRPHPIEFGIEIHYNFM